MLFSQVGALMKSVFGYLVSGDAGNDSSDSFCFGFISKAELSGEILMFCLVCLERVAMGC